jgi:putative chitinase
MIYRVKPGDNLTNIAKRYSTTVQELARVNNLTKTDLLSIGQTLEVPKIIRSTDQPVTGFPVNVPSEKLIQELSDFDATKAFDISEIVLTCRTNEINTLARFCAFLAQCRHETGSFRFYTELGPNNYFNQYEPGTRKGKNLGNVEPGDGLKFKGRGALMLTGRDNYTDFSKAVKDPSVLLTPQIVANQYRWASAAWFWCSNGLNRFADLCASGRTINRDAFNRLTRKINGGQNGAAQRFAYFKEMYEKGLAFNETDNS